MDGFQKKNPNTKYCPRSENEGEKKIGDYFFISVSNGRGSFKDTRSNTPNENTPFNLRQNSLKGVFSFGICLIHYFPLKADGLFIERRDGQDIMSDCQDDSSVFLKVSVNLVKKTPAGKNQDLVKNKV